MRLLITLITAGCVVFAAASAQAGSSCSTFAKITGWDEASTSLTLEKAKGSQDKFFLTIESGDPMLGEAHNFLEPLSSYEVIDVER